MRVRVHWEGRSGKNKFFQEADYSVCHPVQALGEGEGPQFALFSKRETIIDRSTEQAKQLLIHWVVPFVCVKQVVRQQSAALQLCVSGEQLVSLNESSNAHIKRTQIENFAQKAACVPQRLLAFYVERFLEFV